MSGCVFELRLEPVPEQEHEIGRVDLLHVARLGLEIMRLDSRRREVRDLDAVQTDPLCCERQWVEGRNDVLLGARGRRVVAAASAQQGDAQTEDENGFHSHISYSRGM